MTAEMLGTRLSIGQSLDTSLSQAVGFISAGSTACERGVAEKCVYSMIVVTGCFWFTEIIVAVEHNFLV